MCFVKSHSDNLDGKCGDTGYAQVELYIGNIQGTCRKSSVNGPFRQCKHGDCWGRKYCAAGAQPHSDMTARPAVGCRLWGRTESDTTEAT